MCQDGIERGSIPPMAGQEVQFGVGIGIVSILSIAEILS